MHPVEYHTLNGNRFCDVVIIRFCELQTILLFDISDIRVYFSSICGPIHAYGHVEGYQKTKQNYSEPIEVISSLTGHDSRMLEIYISSLSPLLMYAVADVRGAGDPLFRIHTI